MTASLTTAPPSASFFESIYSDAHGDAARIPWVDQRPNPAMVAWLNAVAPGLVRCGSRVAVVGCGLGEDTRELIHRGYDVTAFDISETAINWARQLDPAHAESYVRADLFDTPPKWRHRFDLVVEIYTIQSLPPTRRADSLRAIGELVSRHGHLLTICQASESSVVNEPGPPWPLTREELLDTVTAAGLTPEGNVDCFFDDEDPPKMRMRSVLQHES